MPTRTRLVALVVACGALIACHADPVAPRPPRFAALVSVSAPDSVVQGTIFRVIASFGHGACDSGSPVVDQGITGTILGDLLTYTAPLGAVCPDILITDNLNVDVMPPYTLPYTLRLRRPGGADSLIVIYGKH